MFNTIRICTHEIQTNLHRWPRSCYSNPVWRRPKARYRCCLLRPKCT